MNAAQTAAYLEQLILAERDFAGATDLARMHLHQPLTQEVLDQMQQSVTCALSRLGAAQDMNMPLPIVPVEVPAAAPAASQADEYSASASNDAGDCGCKPGCCGK